MPYFIWRGINIYGEDCKGRAFARSKETLEKNLVKQEIALINAKIKNYNFKKSSISRQDLKNLCEQIASLIGSGLRLDESLELVTGSFKDKNLRLILNDCVDGLREGYSLSNIIEWHQSFFDSIFKSLIVAGEESGNILNSFKILSKHYRKQEEIISTLRASLFMPVITIFFFFLTAFGIIFWIIPRFESLFKLLKHAPPNTTKILFNLSHFFKSWNFLVVLILVLIFIIFNFIIFSSNFLRNFRDKFLLKIPVFGKITILYSLTAFLQMLYVLLEGGVHLLKALTLSKEIIKNNFIKKIFNEIIQEIESGKSFSDSLAHKKILEDKRELIFLIIMGEKTGNLAFMISKAAQIYENQTYRMLSLITKITPIILLLMIALLIIVLVFSIYVPILNFSRLI